MTSVPPSRPEESSLARAGWREWVALPGLGVAHVKAKLDTGARTSSLHAFDLEPFRHPDHDDAPWVRFAVHPWQGSDEDAVPVELPVLETREVRSSSGHTEERPVVTLDLLLHGRTLAAEVTLSNRDEMGFRMLIGREALRQGFVVDPAESYLGGRPPLAIRRRNRGR